MRFFTANKKGIIKTLNGIKYAFFYAFEQKLS